MSSFNSVLLAPAAVVRLAQRRLGRQHGYTNDLEVGPAWLNDALEQPLALEAGWLAPRTHAGGRPVADGRAPQALDGR